MKTPIAEKLAELRKAIGQIPPMKTPRKGFTPKQRREVFEAWDGMCGCGCEESLTGEAWQIDHRVALALGGAHHPDNWVPLLRDHHIAKTRLDVKSIAKCNRILRREVEGAKPSKIQSRNQWPQGRKLQSRGFSPRKEKA